MPYNGHTPSPPMFLKKTAAFLHQQIKFFPRQRCCHVAAVLPWLTEHTFWRAHQYSAWRLPEQLSPNGITGAWCEDLRALVHLWSKSVDECSPCSVPLFMTVCVCSPPVMGGLPVASNICAQTDPLIRSSSLCARVTAHGSRDYLSLSSRADGCYALWTAPSALPVITSLSHYIATPSHMTMSPSLF